jgi:hypothetical protein
MGDDGDVCRVVSKQQHVYPFASPLLKQLFHPVSTNRSLLIVSKPAAHLITRMKASAVFHVLLLRGLVMLASKTRF